MKELFPGVLLVVNVGDNTAVAGTIRRRISENSVAMEMLHRITHIESHMITVVSKHNGADADSRGLAWDEQSWQLTLAAVQKDEIGQRCRVEQPFVPRSGTDVSRGGMRHAEPPREELVEGLRCVGPLGENPLDIEIFCQPAQIELASREFEE